MDNKMSLKKKRIIAILFTIAGLSIGFFTSPYLIAMTLGVSTIYLTIIELQDDLLIGFTDLLLTSLFVLGGSQIGVFGVVVAMGIAFGSTLFLPTFVRETLPFLSSKWWKGKTIWSVLSHIFKPKMKVAS